MVSLQELLKKAVELQATDLHITADAMPFFRIDGILRPFNNDKFTPDQTQKIAASIMTEQQKMIFECKKEIAFSFGVQSLGRFRANIFMQRGCVSCVLRPFSEVLPDMTKTGLPPVTERFIYKSRGLILVTGPAGSGKTTSIAAMLDSINSNREGHILTIENPIEFIHHHKKCIINQREINNDTLSYLTGLQSALSQNADIVYISELPDKDSILAALNLVEAGFLVFSTMYTSSAVETICRIVTAFPKEQRAAIILLISELLEGIVSQVLLPRIGGGLVLASEVMVSNSLVRSLIQDDKLDELQDVIYNGQEYGMQSLNSSLLNLYNNQQITKEDALRKSTDPEGMNLA